MTLRLENKRRQTKVRWLAIEVFGSKIKANRWLKKPLLLYGKSPLSLAKTREGYAVISKILMAISHGGCV